MEAQDFKRDYVSDITHATFNENRLENGKNGPERAALQSTENGRFIQGNPGGPGRPPNVVSPTAAYKQILAERGAGPLAEVVYNDALTAKNARDRLAAASEITDRVDGKATQRMDVRGLICMMPAEGVMSTLDDWAGDDNE